MSHKDIFDFLRQFPVFKDLNEFEMKPIAEFSQKNKYDVGQIVFMQDEPITNVYFIKAGKVKIYKTDYEGKEQIVNVLQKNDMFPHQGLFRKGNYPAHAEIIDGKATLINIPIASFENFLITHPEISIKMFRVLGDIIMDLQNRLEEKILYNVYDQIIMLLIRLAKKNGETIDEDYVKIKLSLTNRELANMIGSSRETVSRTLTQLRKNNLILDGEDGYLIINWTALQDKVFK